MVCQKLHEVMQRYLRTAGTPFCLQVLEKLNAGKYEELARLEIEPRTYPNAHLYLLDAQALALFTKNADLPVDLKPRQAAQHAWIEAEARCYRTNGRIKHLSSGFHTPQDLKLIDYLNVVQRWVRFLLGPVPKSLKPRFGPGSTLCRPAHLSTVPDKIDISPTMTPSSEPLAREFLLDTAWFRAAIERGNLSVADDGSIVSPAEVRAGRWFCVPKNAKTDRSIEIGPSVNVALQLAVGQHITENLARKGWILKRERITALNALNPDRSLTLSLIQGKPWVGRVDCFELNAQELHKRVACEASKNGHYATVDLRQASDSLSKELVKYLLPQTWFNLLDSLRVHTLEMEGKAIRLEKFSGMGNGYTFELESVIFAAFTAAALEHAGIDPLIQRNFFVFGDDIIVPSCCSRMLISSLRFCGLETNTLKTFTRGPFRESCGGDFFRGTSVRPFYLKVQPNEPSEWIVFANGIRRVGYDDNQGVWRDRAFYRAWQCILNALPSNVRCLRGPIHLGDSVIHDSPEFWVTRTRNCIRYVRVYRAVASRLTTRKGGYRVGWGEFPDTVVLASRLYMLEQGGVPETIKAKGLGPTGIPFTFDIDLGILPRKATVSYKVGWTPFS